jgi:hypothetical protein
MTFLSQTPEEKKRQQLAIDLIRAVEALEPIARGVMSDDDVQNKRYARPLPKPLKIVQTAKGAKIVPDQEWVRKGFAKG